MDIVTEFKIGTLLLGKKRCAGQGNIDRIDIDQHQILEELTVCLVASVGLVNEDDTLNLRTVVILGCGHFLVELLNVDNGNFSVCVGGNMIRNRLVQFFLKLGLTVYIDDVQTALCHFSADLSKQIESVHNIIETCRDTFFGVVITKNTG